MVLPACVVSPNLRLSEAHGLVNRKRVCQIQSWSGLAVSVCFKREIERLLSLQFSPAVCQVLLRDYHP